MLLSLITHLIVGSVSYSRERFIAQDHSLSNINMCVRLDLFIWHERAN